jgi:aspartyl aminopeptidase
MRPALWQVDFLNEAWTPFHAVAAAAKRLEAAGYKKIKETDAWDDGSIVRGGR